MDDTIPQAVPQTLPDPTPQPKEPATPLAPTDAGYRHEVNDASMQQLQGLPDVQRAISNAKAALYDRDNLGGMAPDVVADSKNQFDPKGYRDEVAATSATAAILGLPAKTVSDNLGQYQSQVEGAFGWDHSENISGFASNLENHFRTQDAQAESVKTFQAKAYQSFVTMGKDSASPNPLSAYSEFSKYPAFAKMPEAQKIQVFQSAWKPLQDSLASPEGVKALELVNALTKNRDSAGIPEVQADQASAAAEEGKVPPTQPTKIDPLQFIKGLPETQQDKVLSLAAQVMHSQQPDMGNGMKVAGGLSQAFAQGFASYSAIFHLDDLVEAEKQRDSATNPEDKQKAQDQIDNLKLMQKVKDAETQANTVQPTLYGLPKLAYGVGQDVSRMPGALLPLAVPVFGEFAFYKQAQAEDALGLMAKNPGMSATEARDRTTIASAAYGITMGKLAGIFGAASPGLKGFLLHTAQGTAIMQGAEGERILGRQLQSMIDPSFNPNEKYGQEWLDLLKSTPSTFVTLAAFGGMVKLIEGKKPIDPNSAAELEKQAGKPRLLQYLGFTEDKASEIAALPEGKRLQALSGEWDNRTPEMKEAGVQLAKDDTAKAEEILSHPDTPKISTTPDGKYVVTAKDGEKTQSVPFDTQEGAQAAYKMAMEHHLDNNPKEEGNDWTTATEGNHTASLEADALNRLLDEADHLESTAIPQKESHPWTSVTDDEEAHGESATEAQPVTTEEPKPDEVLSDEVHQSFADIPKTNDEVKKQLQDFLSNRASGESGFVDLTPIYDKLSEYGKAIYQKGMTFADWSKRMISELGDKVKNVLAKVWNSYKKSRFSSEVGAIDAWHGTPHDVDRFSTEKIGTGEGAQAYGHGLYFAENPEVADQYRVSLAYDPDKQRINGNQINDEYNKISNYAAKLPHSKAAWMYQVMDGLERLMMHQSPEQVMEYAKEADWDKKALSYFKGAKYETFGNKYKVSIDAEPHELLDWDKQLNDHRPQLREALKKLGIEQPSKIAPISDPTLRGIVKDALRLNDGNTNYLALVIDNDRELYDRAEKYIKGLGFNTGNFGDFIEERASDHLHALRDKESFTGERAYKELQKKFGDKKASDILSANGIKGIRYLDQGSRQDGNGTHNIVVFDDRHVTITERNGQKVTVEQFASKIKEALSKRASKESGFIDPSIVEDIKQYGSLMMGKAKDFASWSRLMIDKLGDGVKSVLQQVWNAYKESRFSSESGAIDIGGKQEAKGEKARAFFNPGDPISFDSVKNLDSVRDTIRKKMEESPDSRVKIYEKMNRALDSLSKTSDSISKKFERGEAQSSDLEKSQALRSVSEINAIVSALPPEVRSQLTRNWRNPKTGEPGNIYTKFASLGGDKARADLLKKTIERASDIIDHQLSSEYLERGYKLMDASQPKNEAGKGLKGKLGAETHESVNTIKSLWHMDAAQVSDYMNERQRSIIALDSGDHTAENADAVRDRLAGEIAVAQIHGNFSPWSEKGELKIFDNPEMDSTGRFQAVEHLKQVVKDGRFDWNSQKAENGDRWTSMRDEVKKALLGREGDATSAEIKEGQKKDNGLLGGAARWLDSHLTRLQLLDELLGAKESMKFKRAIWDASNEKAELDHQIDTQSHGELIRSIYGEDARDSLPNRTRLKRDIANLSKPKDTGAEVLENRKWRRVKIEKSVAEGYIENPESWKGTDTELNYLTRSLRGVKDTSRLKYVEVYEPEGEGDKAKLHLSEMEAIQRLLSWRQPDARVKFERGGMTQETADKLEEFVRNTPEGSAFYDFLKTGYDRYDEINPVYRGMFGVDMPRVKNYAPTSYDTAKGSEDPINLDENGGGGGSMPSFGITRQNHAAKIKDRNAWVTFQAHNDSVNYWISHAPLVREMRAVFGNADVLRAAEARNGKGRDYLIDLIKTLGRDNATTSNLVRANSMFARVASDVLGNSALSFNIGVTMKHLIPALSSAMKMTPSEFITSGLRVSLGMAEKNAFGKDGMYGSPQVKRFYDAQHSGSDTDAAQAAKEGGGRFSTPKIVLSAAGKWGHSWITEMVRTSNAVSSSIAYDATYRSAIKEGLSPDEASAMASERVDEILHEVSQPTFPIDRPVGEEQGMGPLLATLARFAGPVRQRAGIVIHETKTLSRNLSDAEGITGKAGELGNYAWKLAAAWVIPGILEHAVKQGMAAIIGTQQQKEDADRLSEYMASAITGPLYGIYWIGPAAVSGIKALVTGDHSFTASNNALFDELSTVARLGKRELSKLNGTAKKKLKPLSDADHVSLAKAGIDSAALLLGMLGQRASANAMGAASGALNPVRTAALKLGDDGKVKKRKGSQ